MATSFKGKVEQAGNRISETASEVGHKTAEKIEEATDWAKEKAHQVGNRVEETAQKVENRAKETFGSGRGPAVKGVADIKEHMEVIGSCGNTVGRVDQVEGNQIKLTRNDSPDGQHHLIPLDWVNFVDEHVHLHKDCDQTRREWRPA